MRRNGLISIITGSIWFLGIFLVIVLWATLGLLVFWDYEGSIQQIIRYLSADLPLQEQIRNGFFTESKYYAILILLAVLGCFWAGIFVSLQSCSIQYFVTQLFKAFSRFQNRFKKLWPANTLERWGLFWITIVLGGLWVAGLLFFPMTYDEAWFYESHVRKSPLYALVYYPYPGNHILYTLITSLLHKIYSDFHFCMRLPNLILGLSSITFLWLYVQKLIGLWRGTFVVSVIGLGLSVALYSFLGRGYLLFAVSVCLFLISLVQWNTKPNSTAWLSGLLISGFVAGATQPTFGYWWATSSIWFLFVNKQNVNIYKKYIAYSCLLMLMLLTWYLPAITFVNVIHLRQNELLKAYSYAEIWGFLFEYWNYVWESITIYKLGGLASAIMFGYWVREYWYFKKASVLLFLLLSILPLMVILIQRIFPPDKTWIPLVFVWGSFWVEILPKLVIRGKIANYLLISVAALILTNQIIGFIPAVWDRFQVDFSAQNVYKVIQAAKAQKILISPEGRQELSGYEVILRGYEYNDSKIKLVDYSNDVPDAAIVPNNNQLPEYFRIQKYNYKKKYQDNRVAVYLKSPV
ncbi:MAG: hypothetical protein LC115_09205 [Bacteroidia bacterium]|nr:hypothetical protein [Bacteroidia bacterium]